MKNHIKQILFSAAAILFTCSFANSPATFDAPSTDNVTVFSDSSVGGAYLVFAGKHGGNISKKEMEGPYELGVDGCAKGSRIFQFTLEVTQSGKKTTYETSSGSLNKDMVAKLRGLSAGDEFEFKKTKAYLPNGKDVVDVHSKKFIVV